MKFVSALNAHIKSWLPLKVRRALRKLLGRKTPAPPRQPISLALPLSRALPQPVAAPVAAPELPDWAQWIAQDPELWRRAREQASRGPSVLIATNVGGFGPAIVTESMLAVALTLRGARVQFLLCDQQLPACLLTHIGKLPDVGVLERYQLKEAMCRSCHGKGSGLYTATGLPLLHYSEFLTDADRSWARALAQHVAAADIPTFRWQGQAVGEHAKAGALRFFARGQLEGVPSGEMVLRRFFEAGLLTGRAVNNLLGQQRFDAACLHHGIYVPQGLTAEACQAAGVRVVTWHVAYRKNCFIFSHDDTYHHTMLSEPASVWENLSWGPDQDGEVMEYLASRLTGSRDWIWFHEKPYEDIDEIARQCGVDFSKPCIGLLTNVFWDAQLHYRANAFDNMLDWIVETIRYFEQRQDLQLLIRIHPAEVRGAIPSRQPLLAEIHKIFPKLPANVFVIPPESNSSTYAAMYKCDAVLIYGTKTGVELTSVGIPVVVAGEAWIRGKGVTMDVHSPEEYFRLLDGLPAGKRLDAATVERARKYAYHFFFRRMIPLPFMTQEKTSTVFQVNIAGLRDLLPGRFPGLDVICDGFLKRSPFIYPAECFPREAAA